MLRAALEGEAFDTVIVDHLMPGGETGSTSRAT